LRELWRRKISASMVQAPPLPTSLSTAFSLPHHLSNPLDFFSSKMRILR
jgi:hypothetical protein